jgi:DNA-binding SARP family transcriptional activator
MEHHNHNDGAESALRVQLLGANSVFVGGRRIDQRLPVSCLILLAMLMLRRNEPLCRAQLAYSLWPDREERDARANLRRHLHVLHNELAPVSRRNLLCESKHLTWISSEHEWFDVHEFERLSAVPESFEAALYLYNGEFMPNVDHEWCVPIRSRLQRSSQRHLEHVITLREAQGDVVSTLRYVEDLLSADCWREDMLRKLMALRYRLGDRAGALATYYEFRRRIRVEFGVEPMPETARLKDHLVRSAAASDLMTHNLGLAPC